MDEIDIMSELISCYKFVQVQILISAMSKGQFRPKAQVPDLYTLLQCLFIASMQMPFIFILGVQLHLYEILCVIYQGQFQTQKVFSRTSTNFLACSQHTYCYSG